MYNDDANIVAVGFGTSLWWDPVEGVWTIVVDWMGGCSVYLRLPFKL
jgi:hypothetical protein